MTLKIVTFCSRDYERFLKRLDKTLNKRDLELVVFSEDQESLDRLLDREHKPDVHPFTGVDIKIAYVLQYLECVPDGKWFIWCDATAYFTDPDFAFGDVAEDVDVLFAKEYEKNLVNIGVMAIRKTQRSLTFFQEVKRIIRATGSWDQRTVNALLGLERTARVRRRARRAPEPTGPPLRWGYLPEDTVRVASALDFPQPAPVRGLVKLIRTSLVEDMDAFWADAEKEDIANGFR